MFTKDATVDLLPGQGKVSEYLSVIFIKQRRRVRPRDSRIVEAVSELGESKAGGYLQWAVYTYLFAMHGSNCLEERACQHIHYQPWVDPKQQPRRHDRGRHATPLSRRSCAVTCALAEI